MKLIKFIRLYIPKEGSLMVSKDKLIGRPQVIGALIFLILDLIYILSPIDFIPDFIPIIGWIDDIIALLIGISIALKYFIKKKSN